MQNEGFKNCICTCFLQEKKVKGKVKAKTSYVRMQKLKSLICICIFEVFAPLH